ncbi:hypothetical protein ACFV6D_23900 [Kitasatospora sp. NPDC059812]|uniref:hypothetical protein n=1 Tax=Kitasatospora sp. NPDC059812 TaxID=3346958 RepID=UPI00366318FC
MVPLNAERGWEPSGYSWIRARRVTSVVMLTTVGLAPLCYPLVGAAIALASVSVRHAELLAQAAEFGRCPAPHSPRSCRARRPDTCNWLSRRASCGM